MRSIDEEVRLQAEALSGLKFLPPALLGPLLDRVKVRHLSSDEHLWWWEGLAEIARTLHYGEAGDALAAWDELLPADVTEFTLVVTDDDPPPWSGVRGDAASLKRLLLELPMFEYFLCNDEADWVIFDTHHNVLHLSRV